MGIFDFLSKKKKQTGVEDIPHEEDLVGEVEGFFRKPGAAVIKIKKGPLIQKEKIWIRGHTTDLKCVIESMQINHKDIQRAEKGQSIGVRVKKRCRRGDKVYRIT